MHILSAPQPVIDKLFNTSPGQILPHVTIEIEIRQVISTNPDGSYVFDSNYTSVLWDISDRINRKKGISISRKKPVLPLDGKDNIITAGNVQLNIINTDQHFSVGSLDAIIKEQGIEDARVVISANLDPGSGTTEIFPLFTGRVIARPGETIGETTLQVRNELWRLVRAFVTFEKFNPSQKTQFQSGALISTPYNVNDLLYYDGISVFGPDGSLLTSVNNDAIDDVQFNWIEVFNGALLGKYEIEFTTSSDYILTYPDNDQFSGNLTSVLNSPFIRIDSANINITGNPSGKKVEFSIYKTVSGNPIMIALNEIEKALSDDLGQPPTQPQNLPIDYDSFNAAASIFSGFNVYVSETNKSNDVWLQLPGKKPLNVLQFAQKIVEQVSCSITLDNYGNISIKTPYLLPGEVVHELTDDVAILDHSIISTKSFNYFKFQYGWNDGSETVSATIIKDERTDPNQDKVIKAFTFPYLKRGISQFEAESLAESMMQRILRSWIQVSLKVAPQFALTFVPGDRFHLKTSRAPRLDFVCEIYDVSFEIGGEGILKVVKIPEIDQPPTQFCDVVLCESEIC